MRCRISEVPRTHSFIWNIHFQGRGPAMDPFLLSRAAPQQSTVCRWYASCSLLYFRSKKRRAVDFVELPIGSFQNTGGFGGLSNLQVFLFFYVQDVFQYEL
jgi:hypothetical protein